MVGELTVSERILYHLSNYTKFEDKFEVPFDVTQDGISQACSISRAHAAIELKKLRAAGIVEERLSHVRRGKSRRKSYFLTATGKSKAAQVVHYVKDNDILPGVDPTKVSADLVRRGQRGSRRSSPLPAVRYFFGREQEMRQLEDAFKAPSPKLICIRGIRGIGKTTLAAQFASQLANQRVFWYSAKPWDGTRVLADALAGFFQENGNRKLASYLGSGKFDHDEMSFLMSEEICENGYTFVFDDADTLGHLSHFLEMFRDSCGASKILVTCEAEPGFYDRSDVVAREEVQEIELGGLDSKASLELLHQRGIEGAVANELVSVTKGHPLSLEMVTASTVKEARYEVSRFLEEKFYSGLSEPERALLQLASVFERPFPSDVIPKELRHARKSSMLREVAPGKFEIHASLKEFVYSSMTQDEKARWHSAAADYFLRSGDVQERLQHLIRAGRALEAEMLAARISEELIRSGNVQRLNAILSELQPTKERYRARVALLKAKVASLSGDHDSSWSMLESLAVSGPDDIVSDALVEMGKIRSRTGDLAASRDLFEKALARSTDLPAGRSKALRGLGMVEGKLGNFEKAQELLEESAKQAMVAMDSDGMLLAHMELGNILIGKGMYENAIDHFSKCSGGFGPVQLTNVYVNMGIASAYLGRDDEARHHLENAVKLADETGQPRSKAYALSSLAEILIKQGKVEDARESCYSALNILTEIGDRLGISAAYANLGLAERLSGNYRASEEHFVESLASLEGMRVPWSSGLRRLEYGLLVADTGDLERARALIEQSRDEFKSIGAGDMLARAEKELDRLRR
jgi:tetratricopeptide (TPR) repeat protein